MDCALLQQKVEFLEMEIEELRRREENLKKVNNSLMQALNNEPTTIKDQNLTDLQTLNDQYLTEISNLKKNHKEELIFFDKQLQDLFLCRKELQIDLKHQKSAAETEKLQLLVTIKQLETEKIQLEKYLRGSEGSGLVYKENVGKEKPRASLDGKGSNERAGFNKELDVLRGKIEVLNTKLRSKKEKIKRFKERNNEKALRAKVEELEEELENYKVLCKRQSISNKTPEVEKQLKKELDEALLTVEKLKKNQSTDIKPMLLKKDLELKQVKEKLFQSVAELEKANNDLGKAHMKLQQHEIYWKMSDEKRSETEIALKNEIKFLIGKLLKAKSQVDCGSKETVNKSLIPTVRSKSVKKQVSLNKMVSPLDLSAITRSDSPFYISKMDI